MGGTRFGRARLAVRAGGQDGIAAGTLMVRPLGCLTALLLAAVALAPASASAEPFCTDTWTGPAEGNWRTAADWSGEHVPTSTDVACVGSGKTVNVTEGANQAGTLQDEGTLAISGGSLELAVSVEASTVQALAITGGALTGGGEVDVPGSLTANGGSLEGVGAVVIGSGGAGTVEGGGGLTLVGRKLVVEGTLTVVGPMGRITGEEGAGIVNSGTLTVDGEGAGNGLVAGAEGAAPSLTNTSTGTVDKTEGSGTTPVGFVVDNEGAVSAVSGTLSFTAGGNSGQEHVDSWLASYPAEIVFAKGSFALGAKASLSAEVELREGAKVSAGAIDGEEAGVMVADGKLELTSTTASSIIYYLAIEEGEITIASGGKITGKIIKTFGGSVNIGTSADVTYKEVIMYGGSLASGANDKISYDEFIQEHGTASIGAGTSMTASRDLIIEHGVFTIGSGSSVEAGFISIEAEAEFDIVGAATVHGEEAFVNGGLLTGAGSLEVEFFSWHSGSITGTGTIVAREAYFGAEGEGSMLKEHTLVILEFGSIDEGYLTISDGALLETRGEFYANSESVGFGAQIKVAASSIISPKIINKGEFAKAHEEGITEVTVPFENWGIVRTHEGKLIIDGAIVSAPERQYGETNPSETEHHRASCGDPVNCVTGNFSETQTDFAVGGRGVGLDLTRYYNSQAGAEGAKGVFGYGWSSSFSDHLVVNKTSKVTTLYQANGSTVVFVEGEGGSFTAPAWTQDTLSGTSEAGYTLTLASQVKYKFAGASGRLESVTDRDGNATTLGYSEAGRLETITDPTSRKITLAYNVEGLVESAKDPLGHTVKYTYESGTLASITQPGEAGLRWQFKYDGSHEITELVDGRGGKTINSYNGAHQVISQKDPMGHTLKWEYEGFQTKITNEATGSVTADDFNSADELVALTHGYGTSSETTESFTYNEAGNMLSKTDGNGHTTTYGYNGAGDRTSMIDPDEHETKWTYDMTHDVLTMTTPRGETTTIEREAHGNPEVIERPAPGSTTQTTKYKYTAHGELESVIDPLEHTWKYEYDAKGDRTAETDPEGDKRTWEYNEDSQEIATVSPRGNVEGAEAAKYTTATERDAQGRPLKITDPLGHTTKYTYDGDGNMETTTDANSHKTTYTYSADNQPIKVKAPNGMLTETEYDGAGLVVSQADGNKHETKYVRNVVGEVTEAVDPLGRKTTKKYDKAGNLTSLTDPAKRTATYKYDAANRLKEVVYSDGITPTVEYEYDEDGDRTGMTDGTGTTTYGYDQLDRLTESKDGHGDTAGYEYNLANEQTKITYPNGKTVERAYDKAGRLEKVTDWLEHTTKFAYDPDSNLTATAFPSGTGEEDKSVYNEADQMSETAMKKGAETLASLLYKRDNVGQLTKTTSTGLPGAEVTGYAYDENDRLTEAGANAYEYDAANNPTKTPVSTNTYDNASELEKGTGLIYTYDELGERTKTKPTSGPATTYGYDQAGNLTSVERPKEGEVSEIKDTYAYDGNGLRASQTISGTTTHLAWDMTEGLPLILSDETNSYIYGPGGLPVEQITSGGTITYLHHDQQGSTRLLTGATGTVTGSTTFDAYGNKTGSTGSTTPLGYDGQYTSSDTGLIYLRGRTYDPATAQFLSVDPLKAITGAPYNYAGDNPLNEADPTGLGNWLNLGIPSPGEVLEPLNPVQYYEKEIESYENGCGYLASVAHGLLGAVVGAADVSGVGALAEGIAGLAAREGATTIEDALVGLEAGNNPGVYVVDSPEEMQNLYAELSRGGVADTPPGYDGEMVRLPDGTRVGLRNTSQTGGPTIDINGNEYRIHLKP